MTLSFCKTEYRDSSVLAFHELARFGSFDEALHQKPLHTPGRPDLGPPGQVVCPLRVNDALGIPIGKSVISTKRMD